MIYGLTQTVQHIRSHTVVMEPRYYQLCDKNQSILSINYVIKIKALSLRLTNYSHLGNL